MRCCRFTCITHGAYLLTSFYFAAFLHFNVFEMSITSLVAITVIYDDIVAVATLSDPACIILSENVMPDEGVLERARGQGINILRSPKSSFEICAEISHVL